MLRPLQQFICDKCKEIIETPQLGYVEYLNHLIDVNGSIIQITSGFRIVHHDGKNNCYYYDRTINQQTLPLSDFVGENKLNMIFSYLDEGITISPERVGVQVKDIREFILFAKRLTVPYFEEARLYFDQAKSNGYFDGDDGPYVYSIEKLKSIVQEFSEL